MSLTLTTAPAIEPVSLALAKTHCRIDGTEFDTLLPIWISAARRRAEHELGRALITQTWELALDEFPVADIELPMPGVLSIVSVKYLDSTGVEQTVDSADYALDAATTPGWVLLASGASWPSTYAGANSVKVRFTAGFGPAASDAHEDVVAWMLMQIGAMHRHASAVATGVSVTELPGRFVDGLLDRARVYL